MLGKRQDVIAYHIRFQRGRFAVKDIARFHIVFHHSDRTVEESHQVSGSSYVDVSYRRLDSN